MSVLWAGEFGDAYTERQRHDLFGLQVFFRKALKAVDYYRVRSILELGANVGINLEALREGIPGISVDGVEVNETAFKQLEQVADRAYLCDLLEFDAVSEQWDLVFTKGVLIHIQPRDLGQAYRVLYEHSRRYIMIAEYFNATPTSIPYRGEENALFKRDFGGEMLDLYPTLRCIDYGFAWKRDPYPQDNLTFWTFEKK